MIDFEQRNKFLTEAMGGCGQDQGFHRDKEFIYCHKCNKKVNSVYLFKTEYLDDPCQGITNFSTPDSFFKLFNWANEQSWWYDFNKSNVDYPHTDISIDLIEPDNFANVVYEFLKARSYEKGI